MIESRRILALIPARGNSKGIKGKNIVDFCGKPLITHSIESALESQYIDEVVVTTDSEEIQKIAIEAGAEAPFLRPPEYATDTASTSQAVWHAVQTLRQNGKHYDILILLQPTSPLRTTADIDAALEKFLVQGEVGLASISKADDSPLLMRILDGENPRMRKLLNETSTVRRQDMPEVYRVNGSIYINRIAELTPDFSYNDNEGFYKMDTSHSVDIDEPIDLAIAKYYAAKDD